MTEQVLNHKKLLETEVSEKNNAERLELALAAARPGSFELIPGTGEVICNNQCRLHLGLNAMGELRYEDIVAAIIPDDRAEKKRAMDEAITEHRTYNAEYRIRWNDGSVRWIRATIILPVTPSATIIPNLLSRIKSDHS